jgi:hypothetical protein
MVQCEIRNFKKNEYFSIDGHDNPYYNWAFCERKLATDVYD